MTKYHPKAIDALVLGLKDGGCSYATNFPGFHSHDIFGKLGGKQISINERVAFELAYGASMAGKRSVVALKGVGLNVASDPFLHAVLNGINAGLVIILTEDTEAVSSPESQDTRPLRDIFGGLWLEPSTVQDAYDFGKTVFDWSEKFDLPVVIRLTNQFFDLDGDYIASEEKTLPKLSIETDRGRYISYWKKRDLRLKNRLKKLDKFVAKFYNPQPTSKPFGLIVAGNCQKELQGFNLDKYDVMSIKTYPIDADSVKKFCQDKKRVEILEQGNDYAFQKIKLTLANNSKLISVNGVKPNRSQNWITWNDLEKLFKALKEIKPSFVVGDEGTYTDESTKTIQTCLCMGASVGIAAGMADNGVRYPFCVSGDTSFTFAGQQSLIEALARGLNFGIVIIDNGGARSTGGQKSIGNIYSQTNIPLTILDYHTTTSEKIKSVLNNMQKNGKLAVLYVKV